MLDEGRKVLATAPVEVTTPEVTVSGPESALTGARFEVQWSGAVHPRDYVTIAPMGSDDEATGDYFRVGKASSNTLVAPADTGLYELRYVLQEGKDVLARAPIEITEPEVTVSGPERTLTGAPFEVQWSGTVHPRDYVTIVPMGADDDASGDYKRVGNATEITLTAPESPGLYELRYVLQQGKKVMARHNVEVLGKDAQLSSGAQLTVPETAAPGSEIEVSWQVDGDSADRRITVAGADQAIFTWITARKIDGPPPLTIKMPEEPGLYEVRFLDVSNQKVLSRAPIRVE